MKCELFKLPRGALHVADLKPGDSGPIETTKKHCMNAHARYTSVATRLLLAI